MPRPVSRQQTVCWDGCGDGLRRDVMGQGKGQVVGWGPVVCSVFQGLHLRGAARDGPQCRPSREKDWTFPGVVGLHTAPESRQVPLPGGFPKR